jgi:hypothetical protein
LQILIRIAALWVFAALAAPAARAAHCGDPNSSTGYLLEVVRELALKYDLTDPGPIGTLLEGKLMPDSGRMTGMPGQVDLVSNSLFGRPATIVYSRPENPALHERQLVTLSINLPASWPAMAPKAVEVCLADIGNKPRKFLVAGIPGFTWEETIHRKMEGGGNVRVIWSTGARDVNRTDQLAILLDR